MSKIILNETNTPPTTPAAGKAAITLAPNGQVRVTDSNGDSFLFSAPRLYGTDLNYGKKNAVETNNTTTEQTYLNVPYTISDNTVNALYEIDVHFSWSYSSTSSEYIGSLKLNGVQLEEEFRLEPKDAGTDQRIWNSMKFILTGAEVSALSGNIRWDFRSSSGGDTARTYYCLIKMKRIA